MGAIKKYQVILQVHIFIREEVEIKQQTAKTKSRFTDGQARVENTG
jgi:hypothetical protein